MDNNKKRVVFNHEWESFLFRSDARDVMFLDKCKYHLERPFEVIDGEPFVNLEDLEKIFAPDQELPELNIYIANDYGFCGNFNSDRASCLLQVSRLLYFYFQCGAQPASAGAARRHHHCRIHERIEP